MGKAHIRLCNRPLKLLTLLTFFIVTISLLGLSISHWFNGKAEELVVVRPLDLLNHLNNKEDFLEHVGNLDRLQRSVMGELSKLEKKRNQLKQDAENIDTNNKDTESHIHEMEAKIRQMKVNIDAMMAQQDEVLQNYPSISLPHKLLAQPDLEIYPVNAQNNACELESCLDFSRCSVLSGFPVYFYEHFLTKASKHLLLWENALKLSPYITNSGDSACIYVVLTDSPSTLDLTKLKYWRGDGRNHLIVNIHHQSLSINTHHALIAQRNYRQTSFRSNFDIILPYTSTLITTWEDQPLMLPARRRLLLSFHGTVPSSSSIKKEFITALASLIKNEKNVEVITSCAPDSGCNDKAEWCTCKNSGSSGSFKESTFSLIIAPVNSTTGSSSQMYKRIFLALRYGSIPVILGSNMQLPFETIIDWPKFSITLSKPRITELLYILRNILDADIVEYRRQGRLAFDQYFRSVDKTADGLLTVLRTRLQIPPTPPTTPVSKPMYHGNNPMPTYDHKLETKAEVEEILGPVESPFSSSQYIRNFTIWRSSAKIISSNRLYPHTPWDPILPTDAKYHGSSFGFRPINGGAGGTGHEFGISLGGNSPREQFTILMLTYDRSELLQQQLAVLLGLPHLNKVIVVWNDPTDPPNEYKWPNIGVPIQVLKASRNSLNNRFLPYKEIETEAVLSMDDDMYLRADEITFAFRVWRESRDRLVGFPGRFHAWDINGASWNYNSNHSCELSMILTGAAFLHKYYLYQYSYTMDKAIRDKVDEFMNCEDLAMNFLIAHLTRKPPLKVTSRWTFRCPTCGETSLWADESHFLERHQCINYFTKVYGYLPLLYTQYRADSVLFKTRLPADKTKCFTYV